MFTNKQHVTGLLAAGLSILYVAGAVASDASTKSKYAGQEQRAIKSLSANDVAELRRGGGWGLAKVAELNGVPGPIHLLEMKVQIQLSADQIAKITAIYESMRTGAMAPGGQLIELEGRLDKHFRDGTITEASLPPLLRRVSEVRAKLREVHLLAHLKVRPLLTDVQVDRYNTLRGYGKIDPCNNPPKGHDVAMWRKHNGCK